MIAAAKEFQNHPSITMDNNDNAVELTGARARDRDRRGRRNLLLALLAAVVCYFFKPKRQKKSGAYGMKHPSWSNRLGAFLLTVM